MCWMAGNGAQSPDLAIFFNDDTHRVCWLWKWLQKSNYVMQNGLKRLRNDVVIHLKCDSWWISVKNVCLCNSSQGNVSLIVFSLFSELLMLHTTRFFLLISKQLRCLTTLSAGFKPDRSKLLLSTSPQSKASDLHAECGALSNEFQLQMCVFQCVCVVCLIMARLTLEPPSGSFVPPLLDIFKCAKIKLLHLSVHGSPWSEFIIHIVNYCGCGTQKNIYDYLYLEPQGVIFYPRRNRCAMLPSTIVLCLVA